MPKKLICSLKKLFYKLFKIIFFPPKSDVINITKKFQKTKFSVGKISTHR